MPTIELAKTAGFCFGVQRAVDTVYTVLEQEQKKPTEEQRSIYTYGPIVHNESVVGNLQKLGVRVLETEEDLRKLTGGIVVIRAHGVPASIYTLLQEKGVEIVDASCPFVQKIQRLVHDHTSKGEKTFVVGNPDHPEIIGIMGWADGDVSAIPNIDAANALPDGNGTPVIVVAQTTYNIDKFKVIVDILGQRGYYVNAINTICNATFERQTEAKALAKRSDAMIVVGGSNSSNTKKLFEICREQCPNTQLIQTVKDLDFNKDEAVQNVGITAGASTPKEIIEEVQNYVRNEF